MIEHHTIIVKGRGHASASPDQIQLIIDLSGSKETHEHAMADSVE